MAAHVAIGHQTVKPSGVFGDLFSSRTRNRQGPDPESPARVDLAVVVTVIERQIRLWVHNPAQVAGTKVQKLVPVIRDNAHAALFP